MALFRIYTNWTNSVSETHEFALEDLVDAANRDKLKWAMADPERLRPGESITERRDSPEHSLRGRGHDPQVVPPSPCLAHSLRGRGHLKPHGGGALRITQAGVLYVRRGRGASAEQYVHADVTRREKSARGVCRIGKPPVWGDVRRRGCRLRGGGVVQRRSVRRRFRPAARMEAEIETALAAAGLDWSEIDPSILGIRCSSVASDRKTFDQLGARTTRIATRSCASSSRSSLAPCSPNGRKVKEGNRRASRTCERETKSASVRTRRRDC